jgi:hypothetical protein
LLIFELLSYFFVVSINVLVEAGRLRQRPQRVFMQSFPRTRRLDIVPSLNLYELAHLPILWLSVPRIIFRMNMTQPGAVGLFKLPRVGLTWVPQYRRPRQFPPAPCPARARRSSSS